MSTAQALLSELVAELRVEFPGFRVAFKDESRAQQVIGYGARLFGNPSYVADYITVLGRTVWFPDRAAFDGNPAATVETLLHERVHMWDWARRPVWFPVSYAFCAPAIRTMRAEWERRAYAVDVVAARLSGRKVDAVVEEMQGIFAGPGYFYMWTAVDEIAAWVKSVYATGPVCSRPGDARLYAGIDAYLRRLY